MPRPQATKGNVGAISTEHDAAAAASGSLAAQPAPAPAALALSSPGRRDRGAADRLDRAVVLCSLDRQRGLGGLDRSRGRAWPRLRLRLAVDWRLPIRDCDSLR